MSEESNASLSPLNLPSIERFKKSSTRVPRNDKEALIEQIRQVFGRDIPFKMMLGVMKYKGVGAVREIFYETLKKHERGEVSNPRLYFFGWLRNIKVELKDTNEASYAEKKVI